MAFEVACASIEQKQDAKPTFCTAREVPLPLQRKVNQATSKIKTLAMIFPVEGVVVNLYPAVWVKNKL